MKMKTFSTPLKLSPLYMHEAKKSLIRQQLEEKLHVFSLEASTCMAIWNSQLLKESVLCSDYSATTSTKATQASTNAEVYVVHWLK